MSKQEMGK